MIITLYAYYLTKKFSGIKSLITNLIVLSTTIFLSLLLSTIITINSINTDKKVGYSYFFDRINSNLSFSINNHQLKPNCNNINNNKDVILSKEEIDKCVSRIEVVSRYFIFRNFFYTINFKYFTFT